MERIFYVHSDKLDEVNSALEKGGRVKMISVASGGEVFELIAYIVVEYDD